MFKYRVTFEGTTPGTPNATKEIKADNFKITHTGALAFYAQPYPQHAIEAFNKGAWLHVERIAND